MDYIPRRTGAKRSGSTMQKERALGSRYYAARTVKPGFPWTGKFTCEEEVRAYVSGDKVTCLLCGKDYVFLAPHIARVHGVDAERYKEKYDIPAGVGLQAVQYAVKKADAMRTDAGRERVSALVATQGHKHDKRKPRRVPGYIRAKAASHLGSYAEKGAVPVTKYWTDDRLETLARLTENGATRSEALAAMGASRGGALKRALNSRPDILARLRAAKAKRRERA